MTAMIGVGIAGAARASDILVTTDISVSTTWTANNTYNLQNQIYVLPGATLTIAPGTVVASQTNIGGSLAVCRGAQIFVNGTQAAPVIMTSTADVATWVGGNPKTGTWREAANEWGNLTIMGAAYVSENAIVTNTPAPSPSNYAAMEGLVAGFPGDTKVLYGGGNDDDDSGSISYLSLRYGGKVVGLNNELNGLSLGGIGRATDIDHVDIMNNVDDGIEIWGGTVNLKYVNVWNVGDDCFDTDQGWRGKAQFGLLVQGYSVNASTGSGVGDHAFEMDGAEDSDYQPVTTAALYNFTVIGQPLQTRGTTAWRDNARIQYHNCIFMDEGGELVKFDNLDGDGAHGYGFNGTLSWANTWTTPYTVTSTVNPFANPAVAYTAQSSGMLAEITDCVFFRNLNANAYTEATTRGVFNAGENNVLIPGSNPPDAPIQSITRGPAVVRGGLTMLPVINLDPRPANAALLSVGAAPNDGFFTPAQYRGAFAPRQTWLCDWTASFAFGFTPSCDIGTAYCFGDGIDPLVTTPCPCSNFGAAGHGCANSVDANGALLSATGTSNPDTVVLSATGMPATVTSIFLKGSANVSAGVVFGDGVRCAGGTLTRLGQEVNVGGAAFYPSGTQQSVSVKGGTPPGSGLTGYYQTYYRNAAATFCPPATFNVSNGLTITW